MITSDRMKNCRARIKIDPDKCEEHPKKEIQRETERRPQP